MPEKKHSSAVSGADSTLDVSNWQPLRSARKKIPEMTIIPSFTFTRFSIYIFFFGEIGFKCQFSLEMLLIIIFPLQMFVCIGFFFAKL